MDDYTRPDWKNAALVTIDTQRDFALPGAPAEIAGTMDIVPAMSRLLHAFRRARLPIIHVVRLYLPDGSNVDLCRRATVEHGANAGVRPGTDGAELVYALKPAHGIRLDAELLLGGTMQPLGETEWVMYKPRWGAFFQTPLHDHLRSLGVTTVVVCGCNFPNCPRATIFEASERDYRVVAVTDAISGIDERAVQELAGIGVVPLQTDACIARLEARVP